MKQVYQCKLNKGRKLTKQSFKFQVVPNSTDLTTTR